MTERLYSGNNVPLELITKAVPTIDSAHEAVHLGYGFSAAFYAEGFADDATLLMHLKVPAASTGKVIHLKQYKPWGSGGLNKMEVFENPTFTQDGTEITTVSNRYRVPAAPVAALMKVYHTPSEITVAGSIIDGPTLFGGGGVGRGSGGAESMDQELVLRPGISYFIKLTNLSGGAGSLGIWFYWYEE